MPITATLVLIASVLISSSLGNRLRALRRTGVRPFTLKHSKSNRSVGASDKMMGTSRPLSIPCMYPNLELLEMPESPVFGWTHQRISWRRLAADNTPHHTQRTSRHHFSQSVDINTMPFLSIYGVSKCYSFHSTKS